MSNCKVFVVGGPDDRGRFLLKCENCGAAYSKVRPPLEQFRAGCKIGKDILKEGPGTELAKLFKQLGITPTAGCGCAEFQARMDAWGPECEAHREEILAWLRAKYDEAGVLTKLKAGVIALEHGLPLSLEGLLDLALHRAERDARPDPSPR